MDEVAPLPERLAAPLRLCAAGELPPNMALMRLLIEAATPEEVERAVAGLPDGGPLSRLAALWRANPGAHTLVRRMIGGVEHGDAAADPEAALARWAALFDTAARISPEGSVALYALGDPDLLRAATDEIVGWLRDRGAIGPGTDVLDLGCGIGRVAAALAPEVGSVTGVDISAEMIAQARRRCAGLPNVTFLRTGGRDLAVLPDGGFDLVLAVDSFPYLVQAGGDLAAGHVREAARLLRPGGHCVILNLSYRGDPDLDARDAARFAEGAGLALLRAGERPFALWDGTAFVLRRPPLA